MRLQELPVSWVDVVVALMLVLGWAHGRRRGISEELLDLLKWLTMVVVAGYTYQPLGQLVAQQSMFSLLASYIWVYLMLILIIKLGFQVFQHRVGEKLVSSDMFGNGEYYLGMAGGIIRYACMIICAMALLNARYYSPEELRSEANFQNSNFGSITFPTLGSIQQQVFAESFSGWFARQYLPMLLIQPTAKEAGQLHQATIATQRQNMLYQILDSR